MPTTLNEMSEIRGIILKYMDAEQARFLAVELYNKVGKTTPNLSLSVTLAMLVGAFEDA